MIYNKFTSGQLSVREVCVYSSPCMAKTTWKSAMHLAARESLIDRAVTSRKIFFLLPVKSRRSKKKT